MKRSYITLSRRCYVLFADIVDDERGYRAILSYDASEHFEDWCRIHIDPHFPAVDLMKPISEAGQNPGHAASITGMTMLVTTGEAELIQNAWVTTHEPS